VREERGGWQGEGPELSPQEPCGWRGGGRPGGRGPGGGRYRRSILETCILALLAVSPAHGYELFDQIEKMTGDLICADAGTMYRLLRIMEEQGWVTSSWETPQTGPSRRVYALTAAGVEALNISATSLRQRAQALERLADTAMRGAAWAAAPAAPRAATQAADKTKQVQTAEQAETS